MNCRFQNKENQNLCVSEIKPPFHQNKASYLKWTSPAEINWIQHVYPNVIKRFLSSFELKEY
jgi:hypothetical protein